jgi:predicted transcriptional regulator
MVIRYRSRTDVVYHILQITRSERNGAGISEIWDGSFLNYRQLEDYLNLLTDNDLLQYDLETQRFNVTEKGHRLIDVYDEIDMEMEQQDEIQLV